MTKHNTSVRSDRRGMATATSLIAMLCAAAPALLPSLAHAAVAADSAQTPAPPEALPGADLGGEIVVTAQKRSEDIRTVPISLSVLSGADLKDQRIASYDDLSRAVPGVAFNAVAGQEGRTNIIIRGISSTSGASTVGLYLDDVSVTIPNLYRDGAIDLRLPDIERIEVLRGPQGTLYGDSSEGGTIRFITMAPNMTTFGGAASGDVSTTLHGGTNYALSGMINLPVVSDVLAVRASVNYVNDSGWIDHFTPAGVRDGKGVNSENSLTAHVTAKWTPAPDLTITPAFFYQRANNADNAAFYPGVGLWQQNKLVAEPSHDTMTLGSLTIEKGLGFADLTSVTGVFHRKASRIEDGTYFNSTAFAQFFLDAIYPEYQTQNDTVIANLPSYVHYDTTYQSFNQELRLASNASSPGASWLKWVVGAYFSSQKVHNVNFQQIAGINSTFKSIYGIAMEDSLVETTFGNPAYGQPGGGAAIPLFPNDIDESDDRTYKQQQYAIFGQVGITFAPGWKLDLGGRFAHAHEDFVSVETGFYQIGNLGYQTAGQPASAPYTQAASSNAFLPKATLYHDLSAGSSVYATAAKGFRLGGPTGPIVFGPTSVCNGDFEAIGQTTQPTQFASDSLWTYEAGSKNEFLGRRLRLNVSGFYTDWTNIQQQIYLPTCGYYFTSNVGNARIYGAELEASLKLTPHLQIGATASVNHATITKSNNPTDIAVGQHLIDVPGVTATASASYNTPVSADIGFTSLVNFTYTGHSYGSYQAANPNYYNPAYGVLNASIGLIHGRGQVSLYVKNLLDNRTIIQSPQINTVIEGYTVHPRTIGLTSRLVF
ncbi:TonB-dependent receptor [Novosphingobium sp. FKTRR1]|uniref:TonB-dependent receptor n=1 Tax=Novosphingobium sp. FKTRR1 TaxID=2879118 RepID=UPI001CEFD764|nr:TonB-dependent receptor [Novosphingobium sp. FKTRR1]